MRSQNPIAKAAVSATALNRAGNVRTSLDGIEGSKIDSADAECARAGMLA